MRFHGVCDLFPPMTDEEFAALVEDIRKNGVQVPVATYRDAIIDGKHRWKACQQLGIECPTREWDGEGSLVDYVASLNLRRRHLTQSQKAAVAVGMLPLLEAEAAERRGTRTDIGAQMPGSPGRARDHAAAVVGVSPRYVEQAKTLLRDAPMKFRNVMLGETTITEAKQEIKQEKKHALAATLATKPLPAADGIFDVLVLDPPWKYDNRAEDLTHRGRLPYPEMSIDAIKSLPVRERLGDNAIVWLWTTNAFMREAYDIAAWWGLDVKTILTWAKDRMGTGDWLRGQTEHALLCIKGRPLVTLTNQTTLLHGPLREHSRKPDEFYAMVEALCPGTKLEFFAREVRPGWAAWGAETGKF